MLLFDGRKDPERHDLATEGEIEELVIVDGEPTMMTLWPRAARKTTLTYFIPMAEAFEVETLEGLHTGKPGDYLAIGAHGEMYPVDARVFDATYAWVDQEGQG